MGKRQYIFGYGSLVNPDDIAVTLGHEVEVLHPFALNGWIRDWSMVLDTNNTLRRFELLPSGEVPRYVSALNLRKPGPNESPTNPNGVIFEVTFNDIKYLDARETHYMRVKVTDNISPKFKGDVYTYVGKSEYLNKNVLGIIVPGSYQTLVKKGLLKLGQDMFDKFTLTTLPTTFPVRPTRWIYK